MSVKQLFCHVLCVMCFSLSVFAGDGEKILGSLYDASPAVNAREVILYRGHYKVGSLTVSDGSTSWISRMLRKPTSYFWLGTSEHFDNLLSTSPTQVYAETDEPYYIVVNNYERKYSRDYKVPGTYNGLVSQQVLYVDSFVKTGNGFYNVVPDQDFLSHVRSDMGNRLLDMNVYQFPVGQEIASIQVSANSTMTYMKALRASSGTHLMPAFSRVVSMVTSADYIQEITSDLLTTGIGQLEWAHRAALQPGSEPDTLTNNWFRVDLNPVPRSSYRPVQWLAHRPITVNIAVSVVNPFKSLNYKILEFGVSLNHRDTSQTDFETGVISRPHYQSFGVTENREVDLSFSKPDRGSYNTIFGRVEGVLSTPLSYSYIRSRPNGQPRLEIVAVPTFGRPVLAMDVFYPLDLDFYDAGWTESVRLYVILQETNSGQQRIIERWVNISYFLFEMTEFQVTVVD